MLLGREVEVFNVHNSNVQIINSIINGNTIYSTSQGSGNSGAGLYINQNSTVDLNFVEFPKMLHLIRVVHFSSMIILQLV